MSDKNDVVTPAGEETTEEDNVTLSKKEHTELVENLANRTQDTSNLTAEIKDLREEKRLAKEEAERLQTEADAKVEPVPESTELTAENVAALATKTVTEALQATEAANTKANKESALAQFKATHKEFHEDNDEAGLKMSAFNKKLERINMSGLKSEKDFLEAFTDAFSLLPKDKVATEEPQVRQPTPTEGGTPVPEVELTTLSSTEDKLIRDSFDGDKERYLKIKAKRPDYVDQLLRWAH